MHRERDREAGLGKGEGRHVAFQVCWELTKESSSRGGPASDELSHHHRDSGGG